MNQLLWAGCPRATGRSRRSVRTATRPPSSSGLGLRELLNDFKEVAVLSDPERPDLVRGTRTIRQSLAL
jgi:hypothetical protein